MAPGRALIIFSLTQLLALAHSQTPSQVCKLATEGACPLCQNGGSIKSNNTETPTECASCNCPGEWAGAECSLCKSVDSCPDIMIDGSQVAATGCTSDLIYPSEKETSSGTPKELSCTCRSHDVLSKFECDSRPESNWKITISPTANSVDFSINILKLSGTPSQEFAPPCKGTDCPTKKRFRYFSPKVWEGKFDGCTWTSGECLPPLTGDNCVNYSCTESDVSCPPADVEKCPEWTPTTCGYPKKQYLPYAMHGCDTFSIPASGSPISISCQSVLSDGGSFGCYLKQDASPDLIPIGMECFTGACVYPVEKKKPPLPSPSPPKPDPLNAICKLVNKLLAHRDWIPKFVMEYYKKVCVHQYPSS